MLDLKNIGFLDLSFSGICCYRNFIVPFRRKLLSKLVDRTESSANKSFRFKLIRRPKHSSRTIKKLFLIKLRCC